MSDQNINSNDAYNELLRSFNNSRKTGNESSYDDVQNHGEIYFSANSNSGRTPAGSNSKTGSGAPKKNVHKSTSARTSNKPPVSKEKRRKKRKRKTRLQSFALALAVICFVFLGAFLLKTPIMGCINDILAINVSDTDYRVVVDENMTVDDIIDLLAKKKLINNPTFCKLFTTIMKYDKDEFYPAGTYFLSSDMGVEGMLYEIERYGVDDNTVMLTFPEGFTVDQIVEKLSKHGVAKAEDLYKAMNSDELFEKYDFLSDVKDRELRYRALEGYLYPDTYDFFLDEDPVSVIERFLKNFDQKWNDAYAGRAKELGRTVDDIINIASIIQKEANDSSQMGVISSILYNRLNRPAEFPFINCDSTSDYIDANKEELQNNGTYANYMSVYDTYQKTNLPIGPISCPGADAIYAALYYEESDYFYFLHDPEGNIYYAITAEEHENNKQYLG